MSPRTKLLTAGVFILLLAIPAAYVALTWHVADPFRFRYAGHGEVMYVADPFSPNAPKTPMVPLFFEVQNTKSLPIYLMDADLRAERGEGGVSTMDARIAWKEGAIPRHGTLRVEAQVPPEVVQRLEHEAFEVTYQSVSGTQGTAYDIVQWVRSKLYEHFHIDIDPLSIKQDSAVTPLLKDQAQKQKQMQPQAQDQVHLPKPSPSTTPRSPSHGSPWQYQ